MGAEGTIRLPCVPAAVDVYMAKLETLWKSLGRPFPPEKLAHLREVLVHGLRAGYSASPDARVLIEFGSEPQPDPVIHYVAPLTNQTMVESFANWLASLQPGPGRRRPPSPDPDWRNARFRPLGPREVVDVDPRACPEPGRTVVLRPVRLRFRVGSAFEGPRANWVAWLSRTTGT
jgi:hypothetical protein